MMKKLRYFCTLLLLAVVSGAWAQTYSLATSLSEGDEVVMVNTDVTKELGSISSTSTPYGLAVDVKNSTPAGVNVLTVVAGNSTGSFAFKTSDDKYLSWSSGNSLTTADAVADASSWTITFDSNGNATVTNVGTTARILSYNSSSPRFACYGNMNQQRVRFYKNETGGGDTDAPSISADEVNIAYDATGGEIAYTIANEVTDGSMNVTTTSDWLQITATSFNSPVAFSCETNEGAERTATVTLTYSYGDNQTVTKNVTVTQAGNPNAPGTENNPYTVAQALENTPSSGTSASVYVSGIVSGFYGDDIVSDGTNYRYYISDDGTTEGQMLVYRGKGLNNVTFASADDLKVGDEVVIYGGLTTYSNTKEIASGNYIVSLNRPENTDPTITIAPATVNAVAAGAEGELAIAYENLDITGTDDFAVTFCDVDGNDATSEPDWVVALVEQDNAGGYVVSYVIDANAETEERTAYLKVWAIADDIVYSNLVTITQAGKEAPNVTWDLSIDETATASDSEMSWTSDQATMLVEKAKASTNTNNYYPSTPNQNYTSTRFYKSSTLTIAPVSGYKISKVEFTATTVNYANALKNSTWDNASATVDNMTVTVTPTDGNLAMVATIGGTCGFTGVKVYYEESTVMVVTIKEGFTATTFGCDKALDFSNAEVEAFIITDERGTTQPVTVVPAGTGLYITGDEGSYEIPVAEENAATDNVSENLLYAVLEGERLASDNENTYYAFGMQNDKEAFFKVPTSGFDFPAGKAALKIPVSQESAPLMIVVNGGATAIDSINNSQLTIDNGAIYNLQGQRVNKAQKGVFIQNGRKFVVK